MSLLHHMPVHGTNEGNEDQTMRYISITKKEELYSNKKKKK